MLYPIIQSRNIKDHFGGNPLYLSVKKNYNEIIAWKYENNPDTWLSF